MQKPDAADRTMATRRAAGLLALLLAATPFLAAADDPAPRATPIPYQERVDVGRVVVDARPVDRHGRLIRGLGRSDFDVRVDGRPVDVVSVEWIGSPVDAAQPRLRRVPADEPVEAEPRVRAGRRIILFFQRDTVPSRMIGLMRALPVAERFIDSLGRDDRVAIFVYDSHLRLHADFSGDKSYLRRVLRETVVRYARPDVRRASEPPSVFPPFDARAARDVTNAEEALGYVARTARHIPGPKSMMFFSWGLGRIVGGAVTMGPDYGPALDALLDARIAVFALDVTQVDYHTLEGPLERVAWDTGGFYKKTRFGAPFAVDSVSGAISGHYEIAFVKPDLGRGEHSIRVRLVGRKGNVYHKPSYVDDSSGI